nr:MAG TPA: tail protein [Caudoviricetes sp.]
MIYLFNQTEELIDVIDEATLADFTHTIELNQFDRASFEVPVDYKSNIIKEAQFFGFQSRDRAFCLFRISEKSYDIGLTIQGIDRAESDLHSFIIENKRPSGTADQVLSGILEGTGYQLGNVDGLTRTGKLSFYYVSVRQALVKIIETYSCEFKIRYTFVENKIIGRYIDLNQRFGHVTGHQFEYGTNILNVTYEESSDDVVTALIGRGKGEQSTDENGEATGGYGRRVQFKDVVWSVSNGDPVDKPAGQNYVTNEAARNIYGLHQNGVIKHRFGVYTNEDIEDPTELLKATYKELQRLSVPIVTFKANLLDLANAIEQDIWIGDSVGIVRDQIGIAFEARIHKLTIDKLDNNRSVAELGDYQTLQAKDRATRQQAIKDVVSGFSESLFEQSIVNEVKRRNKEIDEKVRVIKLEIDNVIKEYKNNSEELGTKIHEEMEKERPEFVKRIREELMSGADSIDELSKKLARVSETARINADFIGGDGTTKYNKNRLNGRTAVKLAYGTDYVVGHNGEGFESGKNYVISWSATCASHEKKNAMDITIQDVREPALEHNGRYYKVFQPQAHDELITLHHMRCEGDTVLTDIQIEQGNFPTSFVEPAITQRTLSGLFKDMRSIELELRDPNSTLWGKIQQNNQGALTQFFDTNVKSAIAQTAKEIRQEVRDASNNARVQVTSEGVTIGSTTLTGEQLATTISASPRGVDIIAPKMKIKSEMIVDGAITASKIAAGSVTAAALDAGSVTADKVKFDTAFIQRLVSQQAFVDELFAKQATITKIKNVDFTGNRIKGGRITSLNGNTTFDLQTGWIDMNGNAVGIRNRFPGRPLQSLVFWQGTEKGYENVPLSYTSILSSRNGLITRDHTTAGIQFWNGEKDNIIRSGVAIYGRKIILMEHGADNSPAVNLDMTKKELIGLEEIYLKGNPLSVILDHIFDNFRNIWDKGGNYSRGYYSKWK